MEDRALVRSIDRVIRWTVVLLVGAVLSYRTTVAGHDLVVEPIVVLAVPFLVAAVGALARALGPGRWQWPARAAVLLAAAGGAVSLASMWWTGGAGRAAVPAVLATAAALSVAFRRWTQDRPGLEQVARQWRRAVRWSALGAAYLAGSFVTAAASGHGRVDVEGTWGWVGFLAVVVATFGPVSAAAECLRDTRTALLAEAAATA